MKWHLAIIIGVLAMAGFSSGLRAQEKKDSHAADEPAFTTDLYTRLAVEKTGNLFFSPASIQMALAMTCAGAKGQTRDQIAKALHFTGTPEAINAAFAELTRSLHPNSAPATKADEQPAAYQLVMANALWGQAGFPFQPAFTNLIQKDFAGRLDSVDFGNPQAARNLINDWVAKETHDKIKDLIAPGVLNHDTRLVLTNAIYFKAAWENRFQKGATTREEFHSSANESAKVPMMHQQHEFGYLENDDLQLLELPYENDAVSMVVLLPRKDSGLAGLEKQLTPVQLAKWLAAERQEMVKVSLPKFTITAELQLAGLLGKMGMTDAFAADQADFSGMSTAQRLFISAVIHKAYVAVDENGTEAAAATSVAMAGLAMRPRPEAPKVFNADHPFIFLIRQNPTGEILFAGRLVHCDQETPAGK